jgi:hypothetical protein
MFISTHTSLGRVFQNSFVFRCGQCSAIFLSKAGLKIHLVMMHKKDKKEVFNHQFLNSDGDEDEDREDNSR